MLEALLATAFTKDGGGGNPAGVVFETEELNAAAMQRIAAFLGCPETVFIRRRPDGAFALRYFTPVAEVPLCGHATVAAFVCLRAQGLDLPDPCAIHTGAGVFTVRVSDAGAVFMEQSRPAFFETLTPQALAGCFDTGLIAPRPPIRIVSTGLRDILVPLLSPQALAALQPDFPGIAAVSRRYGVVGIHAYALTGNGSAVCRNFAPLVGIDEEAATGTSSCALAALLFSEGIGDGAYVFAQGLALGRPSQIKVRLTHQNGAIDAVFVGGCGRVDTKKTLDSDLYKRPLPGF